MNDQEHRASMSCFLRNVRLRAASHKTLAKLEIHKKYVKKLGTLPSSWSDRSSNLHRNLRANHKVQPNDRSTRCHSLQQGVAKLVFLSSSIKLVNKSNHPRQVAIDAYPGTTTAGKASLLYVDIEINTGAVLSQ